MECASVGTAVCEEATRAKVGAGLGALKNSGIKVNITERAKGNLVFLVCELDNESKDRYPDDVREVFRYYIARAVADVIVEDIERDLMKKILRRKYSSFDDVDQERILDLAFRMLNSPAATLETVSGEGPLAGMARRKHRVFTEVFDYLTQNNELVIEGFMRFRLKEHFQEILEAVLKAVDNYMVEQEYKEFIRLLRYFVEIQEPRVGEVHVVIKPNGVFRLLDSNQNVIENEYLSGTVGDLTDSEDDHEDLLISALITIAPTKVIVHLNRASPVVDTIRNVFEGRVSMCSGCHLCSSGHLGLDISRT